jgi:hypothetical protein
MGAVVFKPRDLKDVRRREFIALIGGPSPVGVECAILEAIAHAASSRTFHPVRRRTLRAPRKKAAGKENVSRRSSVAGAAVTP